VFAQRVEQADARLEFDDVLSAVDLERHRDARWAYDGALGLDKCHGVASFMAGWLTERAMRSGAAVAGCWLLLIGLTSSSEHAAQRR
jgi:hypothetical protein